MDDESPAALSPAVSSPESSADCRTPLVVGLIAGVVYVVSMSRNPEWWDAPERVIAAVEAGFSHPPGSPFHAIAAGAWRRVFGLLSPHVAVNLFSAISGAVAAAYLARLAALFVPQRRLAALIALSTAFAAMVWAECLYAEVYGPHWALWCMMIFHLVRWTERRASDRDVIAAALLFALAFCTSSNTALFTPAVVCIVVLRRPGVFLRVRTLLAVVGALAIGLTPLLALPLRAPSYALMGASTIPETWPHFLDYIRGRQFDSSAWVDGIWQPLLRERTLRFGLYIGWSYLVVGCLPILLALHRLVRWGRAVATVALGGVAVVVASRMAGSSLAAHWIAFLTPAAALAVAARSHRTWLAAMAGTTGVFALYFGTNATAEFNTLMLPAFAFLPLLTAMGLGRLDAGDSARPSTIPRAPSPRVARAAVAVLAATVAAQLVVFPVATRLAERFEPFDLTRRTDGSPGWLVKLAKGVVRKRCWYLGDHRQSREIARLLATIDRLPPRPTVILARWEVQTALEYLKRSGIEPRLFSTLIVEIMGEPRHYPVDTMPPMRLTITHSAHVPEQWPAYEILFILAEPCDTEDPKFYLSDLGRFLFDEHYYRLFRIVGRKEWPPPDPAASGALPDPGAAGAEPPSDGAYLPVPGQAVEDAGEEPRNGGEDPANAPDDGHHDGADGAHDRPDDQ